MDAEQLIVSLGGRTVQTLALPAGVVTVGRLPDNGLVLADGQVSRHHAELRREAAGPTITDLGSANGTFVNGAQLPPNQPRLLLAGDVVQIGPFALLYEGPEEERTMAELPEDVEGTMAELPPEPVSAPPVTPPPLAPKPAPPPVASAPPAPEALVPPAVEVVAAPPPVVSETKAPPVEPVTPPPAPEVVVPPPAPPAAAAGPPLPPQRVEPPAPPRPTWPQPLAAGPSSRYLKYLPGLYQESGFLGRYLLIMESIWEPLERREDFVQLYFDPRTSPPRFLHWVAGWLGLALDAHWPEARRRRLLAEAMDLYRWRGTRYGLVRMIEVCTGLTPEVVDLSEGGAGAPAQPYVFRVRMAIPPESGIDRGLVETLIRAHKPAHAGYVLEMQ